MFDLELHIVHQIEGNDQEADKLAVLGLMFSTQKGTNSTLFSNHP